MNKSLHSCQASEHFGYLMLDTNGKQKIPDTTYTVKNFLHRVVEVVFTQMSAKKGISRFGERVVCPMIKEFKQLDEGAYPGKPGIETAKHKDITEKRKWHSKP